VTQGTKHAFALIFMKECDRIDTTYTFLFTPEQYAALLNRAAELDISLEDLLLRAIQNQIKDIRKGSRIPSTPSSMRPQTHIPINTYIAHQLEKIRQAFKEKILPLPSLATPHRGVATLPFSGRLPRGFPHKTSINRNNNTMHLKAPACYRRVLFLCLFKQ
jgi:hypothetical protein